MDLDEIVKRLEKFDSEIRTGKALQATLENRIVQLETSNHELASELKKTTSELTRLKTMQAKFSQVDKEFAQIRVDFRREVDTIEKLRQDREEDQKKSHQGEMAQITKTMGDLRKDHDSILELRKPSNFERKKTSVWRKLSAK